jgi:hypothetical protein
MMGKRTKNLLDDLNSSRSSEFDASFAVSRASVERHQSRQKELRALDKQVADLLGICVEWSEEDDCWHRAAATKGNKGAECDHSEFSPTNDPCIVMQLLSEFHLATEHLPGSFVVASSIHRPGEQVLVRARDNEVSSIIEAICRATVQMQG